jgi:hypothetical protein
VAPQPTYATSAPFNPYAIFPNTKAILHIVGDLQTMCEKWTKEEKSAKRRLVEFQREQTGSTITTSFKAVSPEERSPNNPCISCILWEKKGQCYVTSVDTIALLEALVAVRFTVEEKNRIRRNLEGFKPYTVSKAKDECDDIFRLIMGFPNPKPRNIEKDIKIFPWSILSSALKKIIGKYVSTTPSCFQPPMGREGASYDKNTNHCSFPQSASYSSTSSVLTPTTVTYGNTGPEVATRERAQPPTASPTSTTSSGMPSAYQTGMASTALSPNLAAGDLRPGMSHLVPPTGSHLGQWQTGQYGSSHYGSGTTGSATGRAGWDMAPFLEPQGNTSAAAQTLAYSFRGTGSRSSQSSAGAAQHPSYHPTTRS